MQPIIITTENLENEYIADESNSIIELCNTFDCRIHIRKKHCNQDSLLRYIENICNKVNKKNIVIHYYIDIAKMFDIGGIHLPYNDVESNLNLSKDFDLSVSCHSMEEICNVENYYSDNIDYQFISPIFNSISKSGYNTTFNLDDLNKSLNEEPLINRKTKIIALGGIEASNIMVVKNAGFDGAALLGAVWRDGYSNSISNYKKIYELWQKDER